MEHARQATAGDLTALAGLWDVAVGDLDGQRGGRLLAGSLSRDGAAVHLESALADPDRLVVVGLIDEVPVGVGSVACDRSRSEVVGYLELLYVEPRARQVGVAEAMVDAVLPWCRDKGCVGVDAPALPGNRPAKAFFEEHGFLARLLVMHRPLGSEREEGGGSTT